MISPDFRTLKALDAGKTEEISITSGGPPLVIMFFSISIAISSFNL